MPPRYFLRFFFISIFFWKKGEDLSNSRPIFDFLKEKSKQRSKFRENIVLD